MSEVVNVLVAFAVIVFLFRWITSSSEPTGERSAAQTLGFRPKHVTQDMVDTIHNMFPHIPPDNIRYDLLRTGNVEQTSNKILEKGFLPAPPTPYYTLFPRTLSGQAAVSQGTGSTAGGTGTSSSSGAAAAAKAPKETLITRYNLHDRIANDVTSIAGSGGKAVWEDTPEKREASLRERKAQMILAARQRLAAQSQANKPS